MKLEKSVLTTLNKERLMVTDIDKYLSDKKRIAGQSF